MAETGGPRPPRIRYVTLDVGDLDRAAAFWTGLLQVREAGRGQRYVWLEPQGDDPGLVLQEVPEPKILKNRAHVDLDASDPAATLARVVELGGRVVERLEEPDYALAVLADPDGNEFCLILRGSTVTRSRARPSPPPSDSSDGAA